SSIAPAYQPGPGFASTPWPWLRWREYLCSQKRDSPGREVTNLLLRRGSTTGQPNPQCPLAPRRCGVSPGPAALKTGFLSKPPPQNSSLASSKWWHPPATPYRPSRGVSL